MRRFTRLTGIAAPLPEANVDTDQVIPARFLKVPRAQGYGGFLFHDRRFDEAGRERPGFVLNGGRWRAAKILVAGANFGCGSSREAAVYALMDYGIGAVIAPDFGDIFRSNALRNGLLPVALPPGAVDGLLAQLARGNAAELTVDLERQVVIAPDGAEHGFAIDPHRRRCLLEGLDDIALTLTMRARIDRFAAARAGAAPWVLPLK